MLIRAGHASGWVCVVDTEHDLDRVDLAIDAGSVLKGCDISIESSRRGEAPVIATPGGTVVDAREKFCRAAGAPASLPRSGDRFITAAREIAAPMMRRRVAAGALMAATALLGSACSGGAGNAETTRPAPGSVASATTAAPIQNSPARLLAKAQANAKAARSGAFTGTIDDQGEAAKVSFKGTADGSRVDVTKSAPKAGRVHLISLDGSVYVKADQTFWSRQNVPFLVSLAGDQFIKVPAGVVPVLGQLTLTAFVNKSIGSYAARDLPSPVATDTINGIDCWVLTTNSGEPSDGALFVTKSGLEVIRYVGTVTSPGRLDISKWNQKQGVTAPPPDQNFSIG